MARSESTAELVTSARAEVAGDVQLAATATRPRSSGRQHRRNHLERGLAIAAHHEPCELLGEVAREPRAPERRARRRPPRAPHPSAASSWATSPASTERRAPSLAGAPAAAAIPADPLQRLAELVPPVRFELQERAKIEDIDIAGEGPDVAVLTEATFQIWSRSARPAWCRRPSNPAPEWVSLVTP